MPSNPESLTPDAELLEQLESNKQRQRHRNHAEWVYWHDQWRLLAENLADRLRASLDREREMQQGRSQIAGVD